MERRHFKIVYQVSTKCMGCYFTHKQQADVKGNQSEILKFQNMSFNDTAVATKVNQDQISSQNIIQRKNRKAKRYGGHTQKQQLFTLEEFLKKRTEKKK